MAPSLIEAARPRADSPFRKSLRLVILYFFLAGLPASAQLSSTARQDFWVPDGFVYTTAVTNGIVYIGGDFKSVSPNAGRGSLLNIFSGESNPLLPQVNGAILAVLPDGAGGWFVGGEFTAIAGVPRTNLAHIRADLTVDPAWAPNAFGFTSVTQRSRIFALARNEQTLYAGGIFTNISGQACSNLAALNIAGGAALPWTANVSGEVYALSIRDDQLFLGGTFNAVGGLARTHLAAVDAATGSVLPFSPAVSSSFGGVVTSFAFGDDTLFVGGEYDQINGTARSSLAAFDLNTGALTSWDPGAAGAVQTLQINCDTVYAGGSFTNLGGVARNHLGALNAQTGQPTDWNPNADEPVFALAVVGNTIFAGGWFTTVSGVPRSSLAALDLTTGQVTPWVARADRVVLALASAGNYLFAGGGASAGGLVRKHLAAFDEATGEPLPWNPGADGPVWALAVSSNAVYVGGEFSSLGGQRRLNLGAVNRTTGQALSWRADATVGGVWQSASVYALALRTNALYAGGFFNNVNGLLRLGGAALSLADGTVNNWNPSFDRAPRALAAVGNSIFAGGYFTNVGSRR